METQLNCAEGHRPYLAVTLRHPGIAALQFVGLVTGDIDRGVVGADRPQPRIPIRRQCGDAVLPEGHESSATVLACPSRSNDRQGQASRVGEVLEERAGHHGQVGRLLLRDEDCAAVVRGVFRDIDLTRAALQSSDDR